MDFLTIAAFFAWGVVLFWLGQYVAAAIKPRDPRVIAVGKRLAEVEIDLADLRDLYERLMTSHKRLRSSAGMAKLRAVKEEEPRGESLANQSEAEILSRFGLRGIKK